jgi:tetrahydromethanopterin S-methyltransferase subunit F
MTVPLNWKPILGRDAGFKGRLGTTGLSGVVLEIVKKFLLLIILLLMPELTSFTCLQM